MNKKIKEEKKRKITRTRRGVHTELPLGNYIHRSRSIQPLEPPSTLIFDVTLEPIFQISYFRSFSFLHCASFPNWASSIYSFSTYSLPPISSPRRSHFSSALSRSALLIPPSVVFMRQPFKRAARKSPFATPGLYIIF